MQTQVQKESIENAIEQAKLFGMLKYLPEGELTHAPFSLSPYSISTSELLEMIELTPYFSELMINVSQDWGFLDETLSPISKTDPFLKMLLDLREHEVSQSRQLLVQRNDFFLIKDDISKGGHDSSSSGEVPSASALRQVEINTVSASFPFLITQLTRLHQHIYEQSISEMIIPNNPLKPVVDSFAKAIRIMDQLTQ